MTGRWWTRQIAMASGTLAALVFGLLFVAEPAPAHAQANWWPWAQQEDSRPPPPGARPVPREPIQREPYAPPPPAPFPPTPQWAPATRGPGVFAPPPVAHGGGQGDICLQLERRLVAEGQRGGQAQDLVPRIEADMRQLERQLQGTQAQLERSDCFETWFFQRTLRRTRQCVDLANRVEETRRRLSDLDIQRQQLLSQSGRSMQDEIIRELARNNCGASYQQEARRREGGSPFSSLWQDEDSGGGSRGVGNQFRALPYATYRTLCVRLCDGYYFPVSFSTLPNHFQRDAEACQSRCAAPVELFYHQNPGGAVEQMVAVSDQRPYSSLRTAFRYRKELVRGCSCKQAEYDPSIGERGERKAEGPAHQPTPAAGQRR